MKIKTHEQFVEDVYKKYGDKVQILGIYKGSLEKIEFKYICDKHGETIKSINAKNILAKSFSPCDRCVSEDKSKRLKGLNKNNKEYYYNILKEVVESKGGILLDDKWITAKTKYRIKCSNHEHPIFETSGDDLVNDNHWCPYCCGRKGDFQEKYRKIIEEEHEGEMLSPYVNGVTKIKIRCKIHNYIWESLTNNIIKGKWCPVCNLPFSEKVVYDYLMNNKLSINIQHKFEDLIGIEGELLKFDFAVFEEGKIKLLIEIDGEDHRYNTNDKKRIKLKIHDNLKNEYCNKHKIKLIRIPYYTIKQRDYDELYTYISNYLDGEIKMIRRVS